MRNSWFGLFALVAFVSGCVGKGGASSADPMRPVVERPTEEGLVLVEVDLNSDGQADIFNYYRERAAAGRLLVKREIDLNWDGRVDMTSFFDEAGSLAREEIDGDFDGNVDVIDHYQGGVFMFVCMFV